MQDQTSKELGSASVLLAKYNNTEREVLAKFLETHDFEVLLAGDSAGAVALFQQQDPDLVILDITLPIMDGIKAAQQIRSFLPDVFVPIICVIDASNEEYLDRCVEIGCDEFITRPVSPAILIVKIKSLLRQKRLIQEQFKQKQELLEYRQTFDREKEVAATIYKNVFQSKFLETSKLRYFLSPMSLFNGDILLAAKAPGNQFYILLGDFTGQGLIASIGAVPTAEIFYSMVQKGFGAVEIITEVNRKLCSLLPANLYLAATIASLNPESGMLTLFTCGLPDHYLVVGATGDVTTITSKNLPLGNQATDAVEEQVFEVTTGDYLFLFTDGIVAAENDQGTQFGADGVLKYLDGVHESGFESIQTGLKAHCHGLQQQDDMTLVSLDCDVKSITAQEAGTSPIAEPVIPLTWKSTMEFHISALRQINPVPLLVNSITEIQNLQAHRESIFIIASELFANALDHGLLELDSGIKNNAEGFLWFYEVREEKLCSTQEGTIKVSFIHQPIENGGRLIIHVKDSGNGFNHDQDSAQPADDEKKHGRGISLVRTLCKKVEFQGNGNSVTAVFEWDT